MNCVLYSSLVTKSNQVSKNIDTTAHYPVRPPTKTSIGSIRYKDSTYTKHATSLAKGLMGSSVPPETNRKTQLIVHKY